LLAATVAVTLLASLQQFQINPIPCSIRDASHLAQEEIRDAHRLFRMYAASREFDPRTMKLPDEPRGDTPLMAAAEPARVTPMHDSNRHHLRFRLEAAGATRVTIHQFYFPGWRVRIDGSDVADERLNAALTEDGRMTVLASPGSIIEAFYDGPPGWRLHAVLVLVCTLLYLPASWWLHRWPPPK
jgi:hypothetical protein